MKQDAKYTQNDAITQKLNGSYSFRDISSAHFSNRSAYKINENARSVDPRGIQNHPTNNSAESSRNDNQNAINK